LETTTLSLATLNPYADGQFAIKDVFADNPSGSFLIVASENASQIFDECSASRPAPCFSRTDPSMNNFIMRGTGRPEVKSMSATLNGRNIGIFPVPPVVPPGILPSDDLAEREGNKLTGPPSRFLAFKGLDTRAGSCQYYKAVGAVEDCDFSGNYTGKTLTFNEWRQAVQIDEFHKPSPQGFDLQATAVFINTTDLNLTRDHHSTRNGFDLAQMAAYVCNHPGPAPNNSDPTGLFPSSSAVDSAIDAVLQVDAAHPQGRNLVACVAMDSVPITDFAGQPVRGPTGNTFARFLIFGPNGDLLPSINLDGYGEKFVPGACVACHGGRKYFALANNTPDQPPGVFQPIFGGFPEDGSGSPDLEAYFLPYDVGNFAFHSRRHRFTSDEQHIPIFQLNSIAFNANYSIAFTNNPVGPLQAPPQAIAFSNLFFGWYFNPNPPFNFTGTFNFDYVPPIYADRDFYKEVVARSCRTCHVAMDQPQANFELEVPPAAFVAQLVCGQARGQSLFGTEVSHTMPNSRVTFDRFWLSDRPDVVGQPMGIPHQPDILREHYRAR